MSRSRSQVSHARVLLHFEIPVPCCRCLVQYGREVSYLFSTKQNTVTSLRSETQLGSGGLGVCVLPLR